MRCVRSCFNHGRRCPRPPLPRPPLVVVFQGSTPPRPPQFASATLPCPV
uniref:Uncharacterized protein n=1 Tax=Arundo donax TaxID=35708 RepID=A0A0A8ZN45_ARUDO